MKVLSLALGCLLASAGSAAHAQSPTRAIACEIVAVQGANAEIRRGGRGIPVVLAMALDAGDQVSTGEGSRVALLCDGGMRVAVGPDTALDLGAMASSEAGWAVFLFDGIAGFMRPLFGEGRFEVRTPSAVASVRSTEWIVTVEERATAVFVEEGGVTVTARTGGALLMPGEGIDVTADGTAGPVKVWGAGRVRRVKDRLGSFAE